MEEDIELIEYNSKTYRRYKKSEYRQHRVYFQRFNSKKQSVDYLHRIIWVDKNGEVPKNCHIHHIDENTLNNDISNLECLTRSEHVKKHNDLWNNTTKNLEHLKSIQPLSAKWHSTVEGKEWHVAQAKQSWVGRKKEKTSVCLVCHKNFLSYIANSKYCSKKCSSKYWTRERRKEAKLNANSEQK